MSNRLLIYENLREKAWNSLWSKRILAQIGFLLEMSATEDCALDEQIMPALALLEEAYRAEGVITASAAKQAEELLMPLSSKAKEYEVTCVAHSHIDMNWMWGYQETASLTIDTFVTILKLMEEYPDFTFSQSQAAVYEIVERFYPELLPKIRQRVHEGRWEVTASAWVENDKNLSSGEAMARHLLYTRRYLSRLLEIPEDSVTVCFEPDTFGHSAQVPEILSHGGVKYYYHCRGDESICVYNWKTPSGAEVLTLREPTWYHQPIEYDLLLNVPSFCQENKTKQYLKVYGVGDHGGGPTRRDLDRIIEMQTWPLFPTIRFGTLYEYFRKLETGREQYPVVEDELNCVFTGCYTSQARTKQANRVGEERLVASETLDSMATMLCPNYKTASPFEPAWRHVMFGQFHDILPGSGIRETREYALGHLQDTLAVANINANHAMEVICNQLDTSFLSQEIRESTATGAGTGFGTDEPSGYQFPSTERGCGDVRVYSFFNTTQYHRDSAVELTVWDWQHDASRMYAVNTAGEPIPIQVLSEGTYYWGHHGTKIVLPVSIPPFGYTSVILRHGEAKHVAWPPFQEPRVDHITDEAIVLENKKLKAVFDASTMELTSLISKESGKEFIQEPSGSFCLATEETSGEMTSWRVGKIANVINLCRSCPVKVSSVKYGAVRQSIDYTIPFASSEIKVTLLLDNENAELRYNVSVDWGEIGTAEKGIPQLNFQLPLQKQMKKSRCVIPYGTIDRDVIRQDVPCLGLISDACDEETIALVSDCKYGFRNEGDRLSVNLIRASYDPDRTPELGVHNFSVGIYIGAGAADNLIAESICFANPIANHSVPIQRGTLPLESSLISADNCIVYAAKQSEEADGLIFRLYNPADMVSTARLQFCKTVAAAEQLAIPEWHTGHHCNVDGKTVTVNLQPRGIGTVCVSFK